MRSTKLSLCEAWERLQHNPHDEDALEFAAELLRAFHKPTREIEAIADHLYEQLPSMDLDTIWETAKRLQGEGWRSPRETRPVRAADTSAATPCTTRTRRGQRSRERRPGSPARRSSAKSGDSPDSDPEPPSRPEGRVARAWFHAFATGWRS